MYEVVQQYPKISGSSSTSKNTTKTYKCCPLLHTARRAVKDKESSRDHSTASPLLWWHSPSPLAKESHPRGSVCDCPCAGLLMLLHPDLSGSLCQHRNLHQQGVNPVWVVLNPSSLLLLLLLALLHQKACGCCPMYLLLNLGWKRGPKFAKLHPYGPTKPSCLKQSVLDLQSCSVSSQLPRQYDPDSSAPALSPPSSTDHLEFPGQDWALGSLALIPIYTPHSLFQPLNWFYMCSPVSAIKAKKTFIALLVWIGPVSNPGTKMDKTILKSKRITLYSELLCIMLWKTQR